MISANIKLQPLINLFLCGEKFKCRGILLMIFNGEIHHGGWPLVKQDFFINRKYFRPTNLFVQQLKLYNWYSHAN